MKTPAFTILTPFEFAVYRHYPRVFACYCWLKQGSRFAVLLVLGVLLGYALADLYFRFMA